MARVDDRSAEVWRLVRRQHGVVTRDQLRSLGFTEAEIEHRLKAGRLHRLHRSVYAVGRPDVGQLGEWMAAVLACGPGAVLSHGDAAGLWGIARGHAGPIEVSIPSPSPRRVPGLRIHRRPKLDAVTARHGIPVTDPICTLIDISRRYTRDGLEAAVNAADRLGLISTDDLRAALDATPPRRGVGILRRTLDRHTFTFTRSALERRFLPISDAAGLPRPRTNVQLNGFEVDFHYEELGLVVETDGLRYHRTPAQQARDRLRDQAHTAAGLRTLRFTHAQVRYQPDYVRATLRAAAGIR